MDEKKAFIVDTNFIIENHALDEVNERLAEKNGVLYVTQVAIDERIAQECLKRKGKYDKLAQFMKECKEFADIKITREYNEIKELYTKGIQARYENLLGDRIIPLSVSEDTFRTVLDRAYFKVPPFITSGTDKGLKDSLMWLSILDYFKTMGEQNVVLLTNDNGFLENRERLCNEFGEVTKKKIEIKENAYYKEMLIEKPVIKDIEKLPDLSLYRDRIRSVMDDIRLEEIEGFFGPEYVMTFTTSELFDVEYIELIFSELKAKVKQDIFEYSIPANKVFDFDERITNGLVPIPMFALNKAIELWDEIAKEYPAYLPQFYSTVANILNNNYVVAESSFDASEDVPF